MRKSSLNHHACSSRKILWSSIYCQNQNLFVGNQAQIEKIKVQKVHKYLLRIASVARLINQCRILNLICYIRTWCTLIIERTLSKLLRGCSNPSRRAITLRVPLGFQLWLWRSLKWISILGSLRKRIFRWLSLKEIQVLNQLKRWNLFS